jgi:diguanylate cyclase (GGDEF)-like protein
VSAVSSPAPKSLAALGQRPPRLTLRVILYTAVLIGVGAATLLVFIRHFERGRAEHSAMLQASVVTQGVVDRLRPSDLRSPLTPARRDELDRLFRARVLDHETVAAAVATRGLRLVYRTPGAATSPATWSAGRVATALSGRVDREIVSTSVHGKTGRVLRTYAPFRLGNGSVGVVAVDKDYAPIASSARNAAIAVAAVLEIVLVFLWLCLIPMMRSATRRIHRQLDTIAHLALHDDLTGLPNRARLGAQLDELLEPERESRPFAVLFIDLDGFKEVNDTLGHHRGNELLIEVAARLQASRGPGDLVARLGGDEFAIVSENTPDAQSALAFADRLGAVMAELFEVAGISLEPQASIGIALAPQHGTSRDELLRCADIAMYAAKRLRAPQVFARELDDNSTVRLAMTGELRRALERHELVVYYQPQFDLGAGRVRSAEALVRWRHPSQGLLAPDRFLAAIERAGLTRRLTRYVLDEALQQLRVWRENGIDVGLAVNVSAKDLSDPLFPDEIALALDEHGIEPSALELEVTEDVLVLDSVRADRRLERLVEHGVRIAIDDFGIGYSSLRQLKSLPAQVLKIDRSFVSGMDADPRDAAIVRSTIGLAHDLGLEVVAEGVETPEHVRRLREAGCDIAQGYHLGMPLPSEARGLEKATAIDTAGAVIVPLRRAAAF